MPCDLTLSRLSRQIIHMVFEVKGHVPSGCSGATFRLRPAQGRFVIIFFNKLEFHAIDFLGVHLRQRITAKPSQKNQNLPV